MKVYLQPTGLYSRAMLRVAAALAEHAPAHVEITGRRDAADLVVSHVIGPDSDLPAPRREAVIQYCLRSSASFDWPSRWRDAALVWSYYDLPALGFTDMNFYHAPLGVDAVFCEMPIATHQRTHVMTSGYVSSAKGEAIEEMAMAAWMLGMPVKHLGPSNIEGMSMSPGEGWTSLFDISDKALREHYHTCLWVSGLRHWEGFELPVIEGLACGARPIVFDRPDMRQWYDEHAVFVPESTGSELVGHLLDVLDEEPEPVDEAERAWVAERFSWKTIARGFWERIDG